MPRSLMTFFLLGLTGFSATPVRAAPRPSSAAVERRARAIERLLVAPCCYRGTLTDHDSPVADEMRREIRAYLSQGKSRQEILDIFRARYGQAVLTEPPASGFSDLVLYGIPFGAAALVLFALTYFAARRSGRGDHQDGVSRPEGASLPAELEQRVEALVREEPIWRRAATKNGGVKK